MSSKIKSTWQDACDFVSEKFKELTDWMTTPVKLGFLDGVGDYLKNKLSGFGGAILDPLKSLFSNGADSNEQSLAPAKKIGKLYQGDYFSALADRESSNNQNASSGSYHGLFQMGKGALQVAGYMNSAKQWIANKFGINSVADYKASKPAQIDSVKKFTADNWRMIKGMNLDQHIGKVIGGVKLSKAGALAATHLGGIGNFAKWVKSGGANDFKDGNGTPVSSYARQFENTSLGGEVRENTTAFGEKTNQGNKPIDHNAILQKQPIYINTEIVNQNSGGAIKTATKSNVKGSAVNINTGISRRTATGIQR